MAGHEIDIRQFEGRVRVELDGEVVADSTRALELSETGSPDRYYLPPEDVRAELLRPSDTHTSCPFKGQASYQSVITGAGEHPDVVWSYPEPLPAAEPIRGRLAFWGPERVDVKVEPA